MEPAVQRCHPTVAGAGTLQPLRPGDGPHLHVQRRDEAGLNDPHLLLYLAKLVDFQPTG
jgi:hypothetical protein